MRRIIAIAILVIVAAGVSADDSLNPYNEWVEAPRTDDFGDPLETVAWAYYATSGDSSVKPEQYRIDCAVAFAVDGLAFFPAAPASEGDITTGVSWTPYQLLLKNDLGIVLTIDIDEDGAASVSFCFLLPEDPMYREVLDYFAKSKSVRGVFKDTDNNGYRFDMPNANLLVDW